MTYLCRFVLVFIVFSLPLRFAAAADLTVQLGLNEGSGSVASDSSGMGNDGLLIGNPDYESDTPDNSSYALRFDGVGDRIDLGPLDIDGSSLTLAAWFKADTFPGSRRDPQVISKTSGNALNNHIFMLGTVKAGSGTRLRARIRIAGVTRNLRADAGTELIAGQWYHAAAIYDGSNLKLYLDGVEVGSVVLSGALDQDPEINVSIGSRTDGGSEFDGLIDDVRIYDFALSSAELQAIFAGNAVPVAAGDSYSTSEDMPLVVNAVTGVLSNDTDSDGQSITAQLVDDVSNGSLDLALDGSLVYTPDPDYFGIDSFAYQASDGLALSDIVDVSISVSPINDVPVATSDSYQTAPDQTLTVAASGVLENDFDADSDVLSAAAGSVQATNGTLILSPDGSFSYTPDANFIGSELFTYLAIDSSGEASLETEVIIDIVAPPSVAADEFTVQEDAVLSVFSPGVLTNDQDLSPPEDLRAELVAGTNNGSLILNEDGGFEYEANENYFGTDTFTYRAVDGVNGGSEEGLVTIVIAAVNDAPIAQEDFFSTELETQFQGNVLANDSDVDEDSLTATLVQTVLNGTLEFQSTGSFSYAPNALFIGEDSFSYVATDASASSLETTVTITVTAGTSDDPDLLVHLTLEDGQQPATDTSGKGNVGTLVGPVYIAESGNGSSQSLSFDGDDDLVDLGMLDVNGSGLTLAAWFKAYSYPTQARDPRIISKASGTAANDHIFLLGTVAAGNGTRLRARVRLDGTTYTLRAPSGTDLSTSQWYHAAATYDGTNLKLYLDGVEIGSMPLGGSVDQDPGVSVAVGSQPGGGDNFDGLIDDVLILQRALSSAELQDFIEVNGAPVAVGESYILAEDTDLVIAEMTGVLANDADPEGEDLSAELVADAENGTVSLESNGSFRYTPAANFFGPDSFSYQASDGIGLSNVATVALTVENVNDDPVATNDGFQGLPGEVLSVSAPGVLENDFDIDIDTLQVDIGSNQVEHGDLTFNDDGSFSYTPNPDHPGTDSFSYTAVDQFGGESLEAEVLLTVTLPPIVLDDNYTVAEDMPLAELAPGVLSNDIDSTDPQNLQAELSSEPSNGTVSVSSDGGFTYVPDLDFFGVDSFTYRAVDPVVGTSAAGQVTVEVSAVTDAPIATADDYIILTDTQLLGNVLANDTDADADILMATLLQEPEHGTLQFEDDGTFSYLPDSGYTGTDSFTYKATDGVEDSVETVVSITIATDVATDPDLLASFSFDDGQDPVTDSSEYGNDGVLLGPSYSSLTGNGSLLALEFDGIDDTVDLGTLDVAGTGLTLAAWFRADSFTGTARDPRLISKATGTAVDDHIFLLGTVKGGSETRLRARIRLNGSTFTLRADPGSDLSTGTWYHAAATYDGALFRLFLDGIEVGSMALSGVIDQDSSVGVAIGSQPNGDRPFDGLIDDVLIMQRASSVAEVQSMAAGNSAPLANLEMYSATEDTSLTIDAVAGVLINDEDADGTQLIAILESDASNGSVVLDSVGSFTYIPDENFAGQDSFTYQASDGVLLSNIATVEIYVAPVNDAPTAVSDAFQGPPTQELAVVAPGILANDSDIEFDQLQAVIGAFDTSHGVLSLNGDGSFEYIPNENHPGSDSFSYRAIDSLGAESSEVDVTITLVPPPLVVADNYSIDEDTELAELQPGVLGNDIDTALPVDLQVALVTAANNGAVNLNPDGGFTYTPNDDFNGVDSFFYRATDAVNGGSAEGLVSVTVNAIPDEPVAAPDFYVTEYESPLTSNVLANDTDVDGENLTATQVLSPQNGTLILGTDGEFTYTPNAGYSGPDNFSYVATDGVLSTPETNVSISVESEPNSDVDLLVHLQLDDGLDPATDSSGYGNSGVLNGPVYRNDTGDGSTSSLMFNGNSDLVDLGAVDVSGVGLTMAAWFKAESFPGNSRDARIISKALDSGSNAHFFMLSTIAVGNETRLRGRIRIAGVTHTLRANSGYDISADVWYHAAATYDGASFKLFLDGVQIAAVALTGAVDQDDAVAVAVGGQPAGDKIWHGHIDDVRLLQRALDLSEIEELAVGNVAPVAVGEEYTAIEDELFVVTSFNSVLLNDIDEANQFLSAVLVAPPVNGELTLNADGSFEYQPNTNFVGIDFFTYQASDGADLSNTATVVIVVDPVNDAPIATDDEYQAEPDRQLVVAAPGVLGNDTDAEFEVLAAMPGLIGVSNGELILAADGSFTYTPDPGYLGADSFSYKTIDSSGAESDEALVSLVVAVPPQVLPDMYDVQEDASIFVSASGVLSNDTDSSPPNDLQAELVSDVANGSIALNADGSFSYVPDENYFGEDSFVYNAVDAITGGTAEGTVLLTVIGSQDPPMTVDDVYLTAFNTVLQENVLNNDTDPDGDILTTLPMQLPTNGVLELESDGAFSYTPNSDYQGSDVFSYIANDGFSSSGETIVNVTVEPYTPPDPDAVTYLPLDDGLNPATDISGFGNHGTVVGATYVTDSGDESLSALEFDGVNDRVELGALDVEGSGLTLAAWFKADSFPGDSDDPRIISKADGLDANDHIFALGTVAAGNEVRLRLRLKVDGSTYTVRANPGTNIQLGRWYHGAATFDGSTARLYLDGVEVQSQSLPGVIDRDPTIDVAVGAQPGGGREFDGLIDDIRILQRPMSLAEIAFAAGDTAPKASFTVSPQLGDAPLLVTFDASATTAFNQQDLDFSWDFGDGNTANGIVVDHLYNDIGNFNATLTVTNMSGEQDSVSKTIRSTTPGNSLRIVSWSGLSTEAGDIPAHSGTWVDQTAAVVFDVNGDEVNDFVIGGRGGIVGPSMEWWERSTSGWIRHVVEPDLLPLQVGGVSYDIDSDGDLDLILGEDINGSRLYWWENPYPDFAARWTRREIVDIPGSRYHDQVVGDFDGDGVTELAFWNNSARQIYLTEIPADPTIEPWPANIIYTASSNSEGFDAIDIDLDGVTDLLGGGYWFKYDGQGGYLPQPIDADRTLVRMQAAQLVPGGRPEVVFDSAEGPDRLTMYEWDGSGWIGSDLLDEDIQNGHSLNIGDVNNDGFLDVMSGEMFIGGNTSPELRIFYGDGTGEFFPQLVSVGIPNHESKLADLDGDGDLDILGKPFKEGVPGLNIWINELDAISLEWERFVIDSSVPYRTVFVEHGDLDGDGLEDIATGGWWWRNPGSIDGQWDRFTIGSPLNQLAVLYDFDEDGDLDVLGSQGIGSASNSSLSWARNDGSGNFTIHNNIEQAAGDFLQGVSVAKFVGDKLEIALSWQNCLSGLQMLTVPPVSDIVSEDWSWRVLDTDCGGEALDSADIDHDGDLDLLTGYTWYRNEGGDQYTRFELTGGTPGQPDRNILADMDNDGDLDALIGFGHDATKAISWFEQGSDPTALWSEHIIDNFDVGLAQSVDVSDLDGDGIKEVVVGEHQFTNPPGLLLQVYKLQNDGTWIPEIVHAGDEHHDGAQLFDADNDGDLDIVSIGWAHRRLMVYENKSVPIDSPYDIPTTPEELNSTVLSDSGVTLTWSASIDNIRVTGYQVFRDSELIATVTGLSFTDTTTTSSSHLYEIVALDADGNQSVAASINVNTVNSAEGLWWDLNWPFRVLLGVANGEFDRTNNVVELDVDFDQLILDAGGSELFEPSTLRCHEVDDDGAIFNLDIQCQADDDQLILMTPGVSSANAERYFHVYFDAVNGFGTPSASLPLVQLTDDINDEGQSSFLITTQAGDYYFHKEGAGFSSLVDIDGIDWIGYDDEVSGAFGDFRGIPNLVSPENGGHFHPGAMTSISDVIADGPVKATISSSTADGLWETTWDIYPNFATLTVVKAEQTYWFLYEGVPGGVLDSGDSSVRSGGISTQLAATDIWIGDLADDEWVYLSASEVSRSLYIVHHENDEIIDSYRPATTSGGMTILGFGRDNAASLLSDVPNQFTIGLVESTEFDAVKQTIETRLIPVSAELSEAIPTP